MFADQTIVAYLLAHNRPILLLHKTLIVFQIGASPRERDVRLLAIGDHCLVDEFSPVIGIDPQNGKGEQQAGLLESCQHRFLTAVQEGQALRPPSSYISERQRVQRACSWASSQVGLSLRL
jgi:hypothetical protein